MLILLPIKNAAVTVDADIVCCDVVTHDEVGDDLDDAATLVDIHPNDGYVER